MNVCFRASLEQRRKRIAHSIALRLVVPVGTHREWVAERRLSIAWNGVPARQQRHPVVDSAYLYRASAVVVWRMIAEGIALVLAASAVAVAATAAVAAAARDRS